MKYINFVKDPNNKFQRKDKKIKYRIILLVGIIALITISSYKSIFDDSKPSKVIKIQNNLEGDNLSRVDYIDGKLFWDKETFQDQAKIRKEIKKYDNIRIDILQK